MEQEIQNIEVKLSKKEKRFLRIKNRLFKEGDIKYQGPLSYRALRILAWICFCFGQMVLLFSISDKMIGWNPLGEVGNNIFALLSHLSTPFFIIASFGLALSGNRNVRDYMLFYGLAYLAIGFGFIFFYLRYVNGLFVTMGMEKMAFVEAFEAFLSDKVQVNVFADLCAFALFHFFMNYTPRHLFVDKKLIIFRLFSLIPIAFVITSFILKILGSYNVISLSLYVYPFLTTKSPLVFAVFVVISLWIKNRERWFIKLGASKEEYQQFLTTNRNSLSVSIHLSIVIFVAAMIDLLMIVIMFLVHSIIASTTGAFDDRFMSAYGLGEAFAMLLAVPFILLYSYQRKHKDHRIDILIPLCGIGLVMLTYVECIYQFILHILGQ